MLYKALFARHDLLKFAELNTKALDDLYFIHARTLAHEVIHSQVKNKLEGLIKLKKAIYKA